MSLPLSPKLLLDSTCTAKNIIPPPRCSFLFSFSPKKSISSFKRNQRMFLFLCLSHPPSKWRMARRETLRRCSIHSEFLYLRYLVNRYRTSLRGPCRVFNAPIDPEGWNERWKFTSREKKRENFSTFSKFTPDSNKLEQFHCTMAEVCVLYRSPFRVRHKCRKFGRKSVSRQITVNRGVIVKQRDLVETWLLARQLSQESERKLLCRTSFCPSCASRANRAGVHNPFRFRRRRRETIEYA